MTMFESTGFFKSHEFPNYDMKSIMELPATFLSCYLEWQTFFQILNLETQITSHAKNCFPASSEIMT